MTPFQKFSLFFLRVSMGWFLFYAGITKVLNPAWSAEGYLKGAKTFAEFYEALLAPSVLPTINFLNEWGLTLIGISLMLGVFVRFSSVVGTCLMILYYFPVLDFPYIPPYSFIIDEHVLYAGILLLLGSMRTGRIGGLEVWCSRFPLCSRFPALRSLLG